MNAAYHSLGKEVLFGGMHVADACDVQTAEAIAIALGQYAALHHAAHAYFHAATNRTATLAAPALRDALTRKPAPQCEQAEVAA